MAKRIIALMLTVILLAGECVGALAADFTTWNKGTILTDPATYFGSSKYKFVNAWDDTGESFSWNWVAYEFESRGTNTQLKDGYEYARRLEKTGFFEIVEETSKEGRWEVRYTGPKELKLSKSGSSPEGKWHVLVYVNAGTSKRFRVLLVDGLTFHDVDNPKEVASAKKSTSSNSSSSTKKSTTSSSSSSTKKSTTSSSSSSTKKSTSSSSSSSKKSSSSSSVAKKTRTKRCTKCGGDGKVSCSRCSGSGGKYVYVSTPNYSGRSKTSGRKWENCSKCRGGGTQSCSKCGGDGKVEY